MPGGPGFEPGLAESESAVLPLDDPPVLEIFSFSLDETNYLIGYGKSHLLREQAEHLK